MLKTEIFTDQKTMQKYRVQLDVNIKDLYDQLHFLYGDNIKLSSDMYIVYKDHYIMSERLAENLEIYPIVFNQCIDRIESIEKVPRIDFKRSEEPDKVPKHYIEAYRVFTILIISLVLEYIILMYLVIK